MSVLVGGAAAACAGPLCAQTLALPAPSRDPLAVARSGDPILDSVRRTGSPEAFHAAIAAAVRRAPLLGEALAQRDEAEAVRNEARAREYPVADLSITHFETVARAFSNDPQNILERSRPQFRTDGIARIQQPLIDFGASTNRIRAANARLAAAAANIEDTGTRAALQAVAAWYGVYSYRALVGIADAFTAQQAELRRAMAQRIAQGAAARGDMAQIDSAIASTNAQRAELVRALASAEAQYEGAIGSPAPSKLARPPAAGLPVLNDAVLAGRVDRLPAVRAAQSLATAAERDAAASRADMLPTFGVGVDAGRYGIFQNARDYDVRANLNLNWRLGGGAKQRADQAAARATGAGARLQRTREEALRDARISAADVRALEAAERALADAYVAGRTSRDVLLERFRVARGTLIDVLSAQNSFFGIATRYIQTATELDTSRYVLLARTGLLLDALAISPDTLGSK